MEDRDSHRHTGSGALFLAPGVCFDIVVTVKVSKVLLSHDKKWEMAQDEEAMKALELMIREDISRVVVTENGSVVGLITRNGIARYLQIMGSQP